jgi:hypothetical protein
VTGMDRLLTLEHAVEANCISLVILLYTMYFMDAFMHSQEMKSKALRGSEKQRLLQNGNKHLYWDPSFTFIATLLFYLSMHSPDLVLVGVGNASRHYEHVYLRSYSRISCRVCSVLSWIFNYGLCFEVHIQ